MAYRTVKSGEGLSSFLVVNGVEFPCPRVDFSYIISTTVNAGRNANNAVIGQKIGRDLYKLNNLEWAMLDAETWKNMLAAIEPFYVPVTFEDYRTGEPITITMYPGDREAKPIFADPQTHVVTKYENCKFNLIDCGLE